MAKLKFDIKGVDELIRNFQEMARTGESSTMGFLNTTGNSMVSLLRANTPVDTGKLRDSWRYNVSFGAGAGIVRATVTEDQERKLRWVTFGTRYIKADPFVDRVEIFLQSFVASLLGTALDQAHRWYRESGLTRELKRANIGKIPGAGSGTNYNKRRSTGSFGLKRPTKGFKTLGRRLSLKSRRVSGL
jgi:HK97 gp10 family phage protein